MLALSDKGKVELPHNLAAKSQEVQQRSSGGGSDMGLSADYLGRDESRNQLIAHETRLFTTQ